MISPSIKYEIDGFRSLQKFQIGLMPGLNVLVGPNGSGKTNFIDFLDFLNDALRGGVSRGISLHGGMRRIFSLENLKARRNPEITCRTCGTSVLPKDRYLRDNFEAPDRKFRFEHIIKIRFDNPTSSVYISEEEVRFHRLQHLESRFPRPFIGSIKITRKSGKHDFETKIKIGPRLKKLNNNNPLQPSRLTRRKTADEIFEMAEFEDLEPDRSLLSSRRPFLSLEAVRNTITQGGTFNVLPDNARYPDEMTTPPMIKKDGSGLTSTLYHLQSFNREATRPSVYMSRFDEEAFEIIQHWTAVIYPELKNIEIDRDINTGRFSGNMIVGKDNPIKIPFPGLSDGTIKWLALVALITLKEGPSSVEEPENFLHPTVQSYLIDLIRESFEENTYGKYMILSTHSETVVNSCAPSELILFEYDDKKTVCERLSDPDKVREQINATGFGLGYYYASGALS